jgi:thioredoxin 1
MTMSLQAGQCIKLTDTEIAWFLSATPGAVMVEATMASCLPCRFLRPVVAKLAAEFAGRLVVVEIGHEAEQFCRGHHVDRFAQLLFFLDGRYLERVVGFDGADKVREAVIRFLAVAADADPSPAERAFRAACAHAKARFDEIMKPASDALEPHIAAVAPQVEVLERAIDADLASGRLRRDQVMDRRQTDYARVYAPFQAEVEALRRAQADALAAYDAIMAEAVTQFAGQARGAVAGTDAAGAVCGAGQLVLSAVSEGLRPIPRRRQVGLSQCKCSGLSA